MTPEPLAFIGTSDMSGLVRGKSIAWAELERLAARGISVAGSQFMLPLFGPTIDAPFATGEVVLAPDPKTRASIPAADGPDIVLLLGDLLEPDGAPWECCPRYFLRRALAALHAEFGLTLLASFEQALVYTGVGERAGAAFTLEALRRQGAFGGTLLAAMRKNGLTPEGFRAAHGARQYMVTAAPTQGVAAADGAIILRELARAVAAKLGHRAILAPMPRPGASGTGTQIHFSLLDKFGRAVTYDEGGADGLSEQAECFVAGVMHHLPALSAVTAPSVASFERWRDGDGGGAVRLRPIHTVGEEPAEAECHIEFRAADATASPYLALGALVWAGLDGLRRRRLVEEDDRATPPVSLATALDQFEESVAMAEWFGLLFRETYLRFKRAELRAFHGADEAAICARYAAIY